MTPTTPNPGADGDAMKAREIVVQFEYTSTDAMLDAIEHDGEGWIKLIAAALHQARKDGAREVIYSLSNLCEIVDSRLTVGEMRKHPDIHKALIKYEQKCIDELGVRSFYEALELIRHELAALESEK